MFDSLGSVTGGWLALRGFLGGPCFLWKSVAHGSSPGWVHV